jgi:hypothetical protein
MYTFGSIIEAAQPVKKHLSWLKFNLGNASRCVSGRTEKCRWFQVRMKNGFVYKNESKA